MRKIILIVLIITLIYSFPCEENPELFTQRYTNDYNKGDWAGFGTCLAKDIIIGGANSPLFQSREQFVDACIALHPTGTRLSEFGMKFKYSSENTGILTGYYGYYMEGEEQTLVEIGYFRFHIKE